MDTVRLQDDVSTLLVGGGRMAKHISHFFNQHRIPFVQWTRSKQKMNPLLTLENTFLKHPSLKRVLLAISDSSISDFVSKHEEALQNKILVHFSATVSDPRVLGFHPLGSFSPELNIDLAKIHFHGTHPESIFHEALPMLKNNYTQLKSEDLKLYHALCVVGGNFSAILWREFFKEMQKLGIQREALISYHDVVSHNIHDNPEHAATGPLLRGDLNTIEKNIASLENYAPKLASLYKIFVENFAKAFERH